MLQAELLRHETPEGKRWASALRPLAGDFSARFKTYLPKATYPNRAGTHGNSRFLAINFDSTDLNGKKACREALLREINLEPIEGAPLVGAVTRLSHQKGLDLLADAMPRTRARRGECATFPTRAGTNTTVRQA
jgi:glycosyltransferase involved in cell wall biosynthesis